MRHCTCGPLFIVLVGTFGGSLFAPGYKGELGGPIPYLLAGLNVMGALVTIGAWEFLRWGWRWGS